MSTDVYSELITLWTTGRREYHRLTATYVTANSLLIASISFLMKDVKQSELLISIISIIGLLLCLNFKVAQERLSGENYYWERNLRIYERNNEKDETKLFVILDNLMNEENFVLPAVGEEPPMVRNYGMKHHRKPFLRRMKMYPAFFGLIYGLFITYTIVKNQIISGTIERAHSGSYFFLLIIEICILYFLKPARSLSIDSQSYFQQILQRLQAIGK